MYLYKGKKIANSIKIRSFTAALLRTDGLTDGHSLLRNAYKREARMDPMMSFSFVKLSF
jgi:hypothetical protein